MKIFRTDQIREIDRKTMELEGISSLELMDRAAYAIFERIVSVVSRTCKIMVVAGPGNNGGDALAIARLLEKERYAVKTCVCNFGKKLSEDESIQLDRLKDLSPTNILQPETAEGMDACKEFDVIIDGLFGSGLSRPLEGNFAAAVRWMNSQNAIIISIDMPSGLLGERNNENNVQNIVRANLVIGLQFPRLSYLLAENEPFICEWQLVDIGIKPQVIYDLNTDFNITELSEIRSILHERKKFSHKGKYGRCLLISGSYGMAGASILASRGVLRTGAGLLTVRIPSEIMTILQTSVPEAMVQTYECGEFWDDACSADAWSAIAVGPGLGKSPSKRASLLRLLKKKPKKLLLDADALNLIAEDNSLIGLIPENTIITPHPGEYDRLSGKTFSNGYDRLEDAISFAVKYHLNLVLKGAYTACINPSGKCHFNSTGNPGMATAGSGDVLTGIIVSLLAQGYSPEDACKLGTFIHGLSADLALDRQSEESLLSGDIADNMGKAFKFIRNNGKNI